ncbi:MAG: InlB B-repeat-containing protein, partial [Blautia sp.]|nr:InlB B-repeat-containing protein [Blautia sp.]
MITGGNGSYGGGVCINPNATFTMKGGTIYNCSATVYGGGVHIDTNSSFIMNGGSIKNCSATLDGGGGGVSIFENSSFTMNGGLIQSCTAFFGGGVYSIADSTFTMNDGTIEDCTESSPLAQSNSISNGNIMYANGGTVKGTVNNPGGTIESTNSDGCTRFYDKVTNSGTISGGIYYSDIQNDSTGTVSEPYYTVSFELNGGSGSVPTQWFVNVSTETVLQPDDPTKEGSIFAGWYNGDTIYDFTESVTESITLTAKWISGNVSSESELKDALNAGFTSIKLLGNIQLSGTLNLSDKIITLDLNGYTLKGNILMADTQAAPKSILTLIDS